MIRAVIISGAGFAGLFLSGVVVSRLLGVEGRGSFSLFMATVGGLITVSTLGLPQGQLYHASTDEKWLKHFMANAIPLSVLPGGVIALVYFVGGHELGLRQVTSLGWAGLVAGLIAVPAGMLNMYQKQYFLALHRYESAKAAGAVSVTLPLIGYLVLYVAGHTEVNTFLGAYAASYLLCFALFQMHAHRVGPVQRGFSVELARRSMSFGAQQFASSNAYYLLTRLDFFIVAAYLGSTGLGIYAVAVGLAEIIIRLSNEVGTMLYPVFAGGKLKPGQPASALRMITFMAISMATVLGLISGPLIHFLFGSAFADSVAAFRWLVLGAAALSTTHVTWTYLSAVGRPSVGLGVFGLATGVDVLLNVILLPRMGVIGAGIAATVSYLVAGLIFLHLFRRAERCTVRAALVPKRSDFYQLQSGLAGAQESLLRAFRLRTPRTTPP